MSYQSPTALSSQPSQSEPLAPSFPEVQTNPHPADVVVSSSGDTPFMRKPESAIPQDTMLEYLRGYDTVIIVDDSESMSWYGRWAEARAALMAFAEIAAKYDKDGIEIRFLNNETVGKEIKCDHEVARLFDSIRPSGGTPLGYALDKCIRSYIKNWKSANGGIWTDDPQEVIFKLSVKMDKLKMPQNQVGIQLVQIGDDAQATEFLQDLDNYVHTNPELKSGSKPSRDMVDTEPYRPGETLTEEKLVKVLIGGINKRIDRRDQQSRR